MNIKTLTKLAAAIAVAGLSVSLQATTITLQVGNGDGSIRTSTSQDVLGEMVPGVTGGSQASRDVDIVNSLIALAPGGQATGLTLGTNPPETANRSANVFSPLPVATTTGAVLSGGGFANSGNFTVTLPSGFTYLVVQWDGQNGGAMAYDIADLAAGTQLVLPINAYGHGVTAWTLLNGTPGTNVPDGGATVALLGVGMLGLGAMRRKLS